MSICIVSYLVHNTGVHSKQSNESLCLEKSQPSLFWGSLSWNNAGGFTESQVSGHHVCGQLTDVGKLLR